MAGRNYKRERELQSTPRELARNAARKKARRKLEAAGKVKKGDQVKVVRFGDPNMSIKKDQPDRRSSFRARHNCDTAKDKFHPCTLTYH